MTATNHVLSGAIIGMTISSPIVAIPLALMSHFVLDALPHYGNKNHTGRLFLAVLIADAATAGIFLLSLIIQQPASWQLAVFCGITAASPDLMWMPGWIREMRGQPRLRPGPIRRFHKNIQWAEKARNFPAEIIWFGSCAVILAKII